MGSEKPPIHSPRPTVEFDPDPVSSHKDDIFFAAIETTRMPMLVTDPHQPDNPIIFVNRAFVSMTGYGADEVLGRNCRFLQGRDTDPVSVGRIRQAISAREEISLELLNYRKDGSSFWNALFVSPIFNASGELVFFFASQLDVSRRRGAEEALAQAQKMEAIGQLTGGISHDFNNLLQVMSSQVELLRIRSQKGSLGTADLARSIDMLRGSIGKATRLTQQLLAFSRKQELRTTVVSPNHTMQSLRDLMERTLGEAISVEYKLDPATPNTEIDRTQLELALMNILVNSRDAMPNGGSIRVETSRVTVAEREPVEIVGLRQGSYASIAVTDTGEGIPESILARVMDPFFTTKEDGRGTGLGLSMVYGFVQQSGGTATIESKVGVGTVVRLYFPATDATFSEQERPTEAVVLEGSESILVVDDRKDVADSSAEMLRGLGYRVQTAYNGPEALERVRASTPEDRPQLLFTDIVMPGGMDGYALSAALCAEIPSLRVLLATGFDRDYGRRVPSQAKDLPVIRKPYGLQDLAARIRQILDDPDGASPLQERGTDPNRQT